MTDPEICAEISGQVLIADDGEEEPEIEVDAEEATPTRQDALKMLHSLRLLCSTLEDKDQVLEKIFGGARQMHKTDAANGFLPKITLNFP